MAYLLLNEEFAGKRPDAREWEEQYRRCVLHRLPWPVSGKSSLALAPTPDREPPRPRRYPARAGGPGKGSEMDTRYMKAGLTAWHDEAEDIAGNDWTHVEEMADARCQSEIEKGLFVTYLMLLLGRHLNDPPSYIITELDKIDDRPSPTASYATVDICIPQFPIPGTRFRAGLAVKRVECLANVGSIYQTPIVIVECDGHDFHERTREQAEHDKSRDRAIFATGLVVLRFTGREIHRDALKCANEIDELLMERLNDEMEAHAARVFKEKHPDLVGVLEEEAKASAK